MGTGSFPGIKSGRGVKLTPHPLLVPWSRRVELYLYLPCGPYGLYRASVPVQGCTLLLLTFFGVTMTKRKRPDMLEEHVVNAVKEKEKEEM